MQLIHLPRLRQSTQTEREALQSLPMMALTGQALLGDEEQQMLLTHCFVLLQAMEKKLLPFYAKLTAEEFDWVAWLMSPELAKQLVSNQYPLPQQDADTLEHPCLEIDSLPQALGTTWALLHFSNWVAQLLPLQHKKGLDTLLLQQLEDLAAIYCTNPGDFLTAQKAARMTFSFLHQEIQKWPLPASTDFTALAVSA